METEHPPAEQLAAYDRRRLSAVDLLAVDDHLSSCQTCREALASPERVKATTDAFNAMVDPDADADAEHLLPAELDSYIDGAMVDEDRGLVEVHVGRCRECADRLRNRRMVTAGVARDQRPIPFERPQEQVKSSHPAPRANRRGLEAALALAATLVAAVLLWQQAQTRRLERQSAALADSVAALTKEKQSLRESTDALLTANRSLTDQLARVTSSSAPTGPGAHPATSSYAIRDTSGSVTLNNDNTVTLLAYAEIPGSLTSPLAELMTKGDVTPSLLARSKVSALDSETRRSALRIVENSTVTTPAPISPVQTGVRDASPTLRWKPIASARDYRVTIADSDSLVVWQAQVSGETSIVVPAGTLRRGPVYSWQVEAMANEPRLSPPVSFWVIDESALQQAIDVDRAFERSALVRATAYAWHGLYEEALTQVETLTTLNPGDSHVQTMRTNLRRRLGRE